MICKDPLQSASAATVFCYSGNYRSLKDDYVHKLPGIQNIAEQFTRCLHSFSIICDVKKLHKYVHYLSRLDVDKLHATSSFALSGDSLKHYVYLT